MRRSVRAGICRCFRCWWTQATRFDPSEAMPDLTFKTRIAALAIGLGILPGCDSRPVPLERTPTVEEMAQAEVCDTSCRDNGGDCNLSGAINPYKPQDVQNLQCHITDAGVTAACSYEITPPRNLDRGTSRPNLRFIGSAEFTISPDTGDWCKITGGFYDELSEVWQSIRANQRGDGGK